MNNAKTKWAGFATLWKEEASCDEDTTNAPSEVDVEAPPATVSKGAWTDSLNAVQKDLPISPTAIVDDLGVGTGDKSVGSDSSVCDTAAAPSETFSYTLSISDTANYLSKCSDIAIVGDFEDKPSFDIDALPTPAFSLLALRDAPMVLGLEEKHENAKTSTGLQAMDKNRTRSSKSFTTASVSPAVKEIVFTQGHGCSPASEKTSQQTCLAEKQIPVDTNIGYKITSGESTLLRQEAETITSEIRPMSPNESFVPGAYAVDDTNAYTGNEEHMSSFVEHSRLPVSTELVDPDEEKRILEQQLREILEAGHQNAAVAEIVTENGCSRSRIVCLAGVAIVSIAVVLAISLKYSRQLLSPDSLAPISAPQAPPQQELIDLISSVSLDEGESLMNNSTPQSKAIQWLGNNTNLANYTDNQKLQRYALATFYYSTGGDKWFNNTGWLADSNECVWDHVTNCSESGVVLDLTCRCDMNLYGTLPDEIALLSDLQGTHFNTSTLC